MWRASRQSSSLPSLVLAVRANSLWIDSHATPPFKRMPNDPLNEIWDQVDTQISFYQDVPSIIAGLRATEGVQIALCSRTHAPPA
jgi:magnesium-dependent phosphatase 1